MRAGAFFSTLIPIFAFAFAACAGGSPSGGSALYDPRALPTGAPGEAIAYGHALITKTNGLMRAYVRADLTCANCHIAAGTKPRGGSFIGTYARFPQWNGRAHRMIALQDRIAECFLYSMNGRAPAYSSKQMIAIVAYIAWLSRGTSTGAPLPASDRYLAPSPSAPPNVARGAAIYDQQCVVCHKTNGRGISGLFPPLWGRTSFNDGAGMSHIARMAGFIKYNMPYSNPGSLSFDQAYDVAAFVLRHSRPHFVRNALEPMPSLPAKYF